MRLGIVVTEPSADNLGAGLVRSLRQRDSIQPEGIGGEQLTSLGLASATPMERLAVIGLAEPLRRLPELLSIRSALLARWRENPPDAFVGVDAPDFNLPLARKLRSNGISTAHYVSPSVWAWRPGRVKKVAASVDMVLCLFPFELKFYQEQPVRAEWVGHPLADSIEPDDSGVLKEEARRELGLGDAPCLALLPGSRGGEVAAMTPIMLDAATQLEQLHPGMKILISAATSEREQQLQTLCRGTGVEVVTGDMRKLVRAADAVVVTSGTATLEVALLRRPMVVVYRLGRLTHAILSRMLITPWVALPNILANRTLVPELIQDEANARNIVREVDALLSGDRSGLMQAYAEIHQSLRRDTNERAAECVRDLLRC